MAKGKRKPRAASLPPTFSKAEPPSGFPSSIFSGKSAAEDLKDLRKLIPQGRLPRLDQLPTYALRRLSPVNAFIFGAGLLLGAFTVTFAEEIFPSSNGSSKPRESAKKSIWRRSAPGTLSELLPFGIPGDSHLLLRREACKI